MDKFEIYVGQDKKVCLNCGKEFPQIGLRPVNNSYGLTVDFCPDCLRKLASIIEKVEGESK